MPNEKYIEVLKALRLIDDVLFSACFDDNPEDMQYILRIILDKPDLKVLKVQTQKSVENLYGRSVRFDVFATDDIGKLYNIEVQRADSGASPARARYNSSMLDYHELQKSRDFKELPQSFVIFITENDVLKCGQKIYHIDRVVRETGNFFDDGTQIIYVNGSYKGKVGEPLDDLIHDFFCESPADMRHKQLADRIKFLKNIEKGGTAMCEVIQKVFAEEFAEQEKQTKLEDIRNLMDSTKWSLEKVMDALKIPPHLQAELKTLL